MFDIFRHKQKQAVIDDTERLIQARKKEFSQKVDKDLENIENINKVLRNGITLRIYHATGGK